jgi:2-polyprenyl-6-methoxyphenol hydroxylase-like FAD-dependent oxidoreductase
MRILISGSGIAGPSLAFWLSKCARHQVTVLEKAPVLLPHGQNVDLQGAAVTAIRKMGLLDQVCAHNTTEKGTQFIDAAGKAFAPFPVKQGATASLSSEYEILRGDLAKILHEATRDKSNVTYLFGTTIITVISNEPGGVEVELNSGEVQKYDLLVAADGQWSKVRSQCFAPEDVGGKHMGMYAVYYTVPREETDNEWWNIYVALGSRIVTTRPDPHETIRAMFTIMPSTKAQAEAWKNASKSGRSAQERLLRREFDDSGWQTQRLLSAMKTAPDFYFHSIQQVKMRAWSQNRVVCLGDAAYCPTPLTGMGTSLAIIGAYMLAGELNTLSDPCKALGSYERKFRPFVEQTQEIPRAVPRIMHPATAWKRWLLHTCLRLASRVVAVPWVVNHSKDPEANDDGFMLPEYKLADTDGSEYGE